MSIMKFINYLFTNKLSIRWRMWRCVLIIFGLSVIWLIVWLIFANQWLTTDRIIWQLNKPEVISQINKISQLLSWDQYIQISEVSWFITNKTGIRFDQSNAKVEVNLSGNCENWFTSNDNKQWALITNKSLCFNWNNKKQIITWAQIMSGITSNTGMQNNEITNFLARYQSFGQILSWGVITIDQQKLIWLTSDIKIITQDKQIIDILIRWIHNIATIMLIPLWLIAIFFATVMTIILFIWLIIYSLIARAIAGIMKYDIDFNQAFALSWLPWMVIRVLGIVIWFNWYIGILVWIIIVTRIIYYHNQTIKS